MKTVISLPDAPLKFPLLVKHRSTGCVVLLQDTKHGTILQGVVGFPMGEFIIWAYDVTNAQHWEILPEGTTVTLTQ